MAGIKPYTHETVLQLLAESHQRYAELNERRRWERQLVATGSMRALAASEGLDEDETTSIFRRLVKTNPHQINLLLPAVTLWHASIVPPAIEHNVEARSGGEHGDNLATIAGAKLDDLWYRAGTTDLKRAAMDYTVIGEGLLKVTYQVNERERETTAEEREAEYDRLVDAATDVAIAHGRRPSDMVNHDDLADQLTLTTTDIVGEGVVVNYADPLDFRVDEHASDLNDARWVAHRMVFPYDEVCENPRYDKSVKVLPDGEVGGGQLLGRGREAYSDPNSGKPEHGLTCIVWEFYDCRTRKLMILQEGSEAPLLYSDWPYEFAGVPFAHKAMFREQPSDFHGFGVIRNTASLQAMHNEMLAKQAENADRATAHKYLVSAEFALDQEAKDAMESNIGGEVVRIDTNGQPIQNAIVPFQPNPLSSEVFQLKQTAEDGVTKVLGLNEFQAGGSPLVSHVPATAVAVADGTATTRLQVPVHDIEDLVAETSRIGLHFIREFEFADDFAAEAAGEEPKGKPLHIRTPNGAKEAQIYGWMLDGDFEVHVTSASQGKNEATKNQDGMDLLSGVLPTLIQMFPDLDPEPLAKHALSLMGKNPDTYFKLKPPAPAAPAQLGAGPTPEMPADLGPQSSAGGMAANAQLDGGVAL